MMTPVADLRIRGLAAADLDRVTEIGRDLSHAPHWPRWVYEAVLDPAFPKRIALVAEMAETDKIAGFVVAGILLPQAELESIAVLVDHQRCGIGRKLLSAMVEELKATGASEFILEVRASNEQARGFYRSLGWRENGWRPRYYTDPEEDAVLMSRELG
jgi:ribosomal-protein-alanine acetyltransferase